ncbi:MAG: hypothetical protein ACXW2U_00810 [Telluria sp.]
MYQAMQSVKVVQDVHTEDGELLLSAGQAGHVVDDKTTLVNGAYEGTLSVKMDVDNQVYELDATHVQGL